MADASGAPGAAVPTMNRVEMRAQGMLMQFLGLDSEAHRKKVHGALLQTYVAMVKALRPEVVLEIGAHEARFSVSVRRAAKEEDLKVVAFEANPDVWNTHQARLAKEGVEYRNLAVADRAGTLRFRVPLVRGQEGRTTGSLLEFSARMATEFVEHEVEAVRLDDQGFARAALWIDVEGATREVLAGAETTLGTCVAAFVEVEEDERWPGQMVADAVLDHFESRGFAALLRDVQRDWQYNVLFVRKDLLFDHRITPFRRRYLAQLRHMAGLPGEVEQVHPAEARKARRLAERKASRVAQART